MIEIPNLTPTDRGRWVRYIAGGQNRLGCILRWDDWLVYVVWSRNEKLRLFDTDHYEVSAVNPADLEFFDPEAARTGMAASQRAEEAKEIQFERITGNQKH